MAARIRCRLFFMRPLFLDLPVRKKKKYNLYNSAYNKSSDIDYDYLSYILGRGYSTRSQRILIIIWAIVMIYLILWNVHILYKLHILLYTYTLADTHMSNTYASLQLQTHDIYIYIYMTINDNDRRHTSILWVVTLLRCVCTKKILFFNFLLYCNSDHVIVEIF